MNWYFSFWKMGLISADIRSVSGGYIFFQHGTGIRWLLGLVFATNIRLSWVEGRFIEAKAPTPIWWKRVESNVGKWPWFIFLTSYDAIFLPQKNTGAPKEFLRESRLRKLGAPLSFEFMSPPRPKKNFSFCRDRLQVVFFFGTRLGAWDPFT